VSAELPPHLDLQPRLASLLKAFGPNRLMWGSDFPFVTLGGQTRTQDALTYEQAAAVPSFWSVEGLDGAAMEALMGGTAARLFHFDQKA
jgi:predicted TIM-barrel fold metal-dependent hydrolase